MLGVRRSAVWRCSIRTSKLLEEMKLGTIYHYISLRKLRWAGHIARMAQDRAPRKFLTSWVRRPRPHGRPQFTFGHSLNKTLTRAGIPTDALHSTDPLSQAQTDLIMGRLTPEEGREGEEGGEEEEEEEGLEEEEELVDTAVTPVPPMEAESEAIFESMIPGPNEIVSDLDASTHELDLEGKSVKKAMVIRQLLGRGKPMSSDRLRRVRGMGRRLGKTRAWASLMTRRRILTHQNTTRSQCSAIRWPLLPSVVTG